MKRPLGAVRLLAVLLPLVLLGCGTPRYASHWGRLREGMTQTEVESVLGKPSAKVLLDRGEGRLVRERWQYGETAPSAPATSKLGFAPPDDVFVVYFGADGRVSDSRRPLVGRYAESEPVAARSH